MRILSNGLPLGGIVLEKFGQVRVSHMQAYEGTGLGLPLAKTFMEMQGGGLTMESELEVGTKVTIYFPVERTLT